MFPGFGFPAFGFPRFAFPTFYGPILFENELALYILANAGIKARPMALPSSDTAYPLISYMIIDGESEVGLDGPTGQADKVVQIDCFSPIFSDAASTLEKVKKLFVPFQGRAGPMGRIWITNLERGRNRTTATEPVNKQSGSTMYQVMFELTFYYYEQLI